MLSLTAERFDVPYDVEERLTVSANLTDNSKSCIEGTPSGSDFVCVIDRSYSMEGRPWSLIKESLHFLVDRSSSEYRMCFVTFGSSARIETGLTYMDRSGKKQFHKTVDRLNVDGCTALSEGLLLALAHLKQARSTSRPATILLFTDGCANTGITLTELLVKEIQSRLSILPGASSVAIHAIGLGEAHDELMLTAIADTARGQYYYVEQTKDIPKIFEECVGGVLTTTAVDMMLNVTAESGCSIAQLHNGKYRVTNDGPNGINIAVGELRSGERKNILVQLNIPKLSRPSVATRVCTFALTYRNTASQLRAPQIVSIDIRRELSVDANDHTCPPVICTSEQIHLDEQQNRLRVAEALELAAKETGTQVQMILQKALDSVQTSISHATALSLQLANSLNQAMAQSNRGEGVSPKMLFAMSRSHFNQRSSGITVGDAQLYMTASQRRLICGHTGVQQTEHEIFSGPTNLGRSQLHEHWGAKDEQSDDDDCNSITDNSLSSDSTAGGSMSRINVVQGLVFVNNGGTPRPFAKSSTIPREEHRQFTTDHKIHASPPRHNEQRVGRAVRRLMLDFAELQKSPSSDAIAAPLESDVFEWHGCLFATDARNLAVHFVMFFPPTYPSAPPKLFLSSFVPSSHVFGSWVCLDLLEEHHFTAVPYRGWTSAYTVHAVLLQLQSFLFSEPATKSDIAKMTMAAERFACDKCPHTYSTPWPAQPEVEQLQEKNLKGSSTLLDGLLLTESINISLCLGSDKTSLTDCDENNSHKSMTSKQAWQNVPREVYQAKAATGKAPRSSLAKANTHGASIWQQDNCLVKYAPGRNCLVNDPAAHAEHIPAISSERNQNKRTTGHVVRLKDQSTKTKADTRVDGGLSRWQQGPLKNSRKPVTNGRKEIGSSAIISLINLNDKCLIRILKFVISEQGASSPSLLSQNFNAFAASCRRFYVLSNDISLWRRLFQQLLPAHTAERLQWQSSSANNELVLSRRSVSEWKHILMRERDRAASHQICFHTKLSFRETTLGIPIVAKRHVSPSVDVTSESYNIESLSTPFDLIAHDAFKLDHVRNSVWKVKFEYWIPLFISRTHIDRAIGAGLLQESIARLCLGDTLNTRSAAWFANTFEQNPRMALTVLPKLMNAMVVQLMSGKLHASISALDGYCAVHRLLFFLVQESQWSDSLRNHVNRVTASFKRGNTQKAQVPNLGDFLALLSVSDAVSWQDTKVAYMLETFDRNALWAIRKFPFLSSTSSSVSTQERLQSTWAATQTSMKLLAFHVYFFEKFARPRTLSMKQVIGGSDVLFARPSAEQQDLLQRHCKKVLLEINNWDKFFEHGLGLSKPADTILGRWLVDSVRNSERKGYHTPRRVQRRRW